MATEEKKYKPIPKYPPIIEDLSFIIPAKTYLKDVVDLIKKTGLIIQTVDLIDTYEDSRTFRLTYQDQQKTLTDKEVAEIRKKVISNLQEKLKVKLKGSKD